MFTEERQGDGLEEAGRTKAAQAALERRRLNRLRDPEGWRPPPAPEADFLLVAPCATAGESPEDRAVFDVEALAALPPDVRAEAQLVREALDLFAAGEPPVALHHLAPIGRKSPFAEWRLFLRGLAPFQTGDMDGAHEAWSRLARDRRPARIAEVLAAAWEKACPNTEWSPRVAVTTDPAAVAGAASLLTRRSLWEAAREIVTVRHRHPGKSFSASQAALTIRLAKQYQAIDPDFVRDFTATCRSLAMRQEDDEPFVSLCRGTVGPIDDPRCTRLRMVHLALRDSLDAAIVPHARDYVDRDLPAVDSLPAPLRDALASVALERAARSIDASMDDVFFTSPSRDRGLATRLLEEALTRCPGNLRAHESLIDLLDGNVDDDDPRSGQALIAAKLALVEAFPDRHVHVLELVEHFVAAGDFTRAEPLVRSLAEQRCDTPRAQAAVWRFEIRRAGSLAARRDALPAARGALQAAVAAWPAWVSRHWLPWLEAAFLFRAGDQTGYEQAVSAARQATPDRLGGDVYLHEAALLLGWPAARIKPVRTAVRNAAKRGVTAAPLGSLAAAVRFYDSIERCGIDVTTDDHPGLALGRAVCARLGKQAAPGDGGLSAVVDGPDFWPAFRWVAQHAFCGALKPGRESKGMASLIDSQPQAAAEFLSWLATAAPDKLTGRKSLARLDRVEAAAAAEADPAVRGRLADVAARVRKAVAEARNTQRRRRRPPFFSPFQFVPGSQGGVKPAGGMSSLLNLIFARGGPAAVAKALTLITRTPPPKCYPALAQLCAGLGITQKQFHRAVGESFSPNTTTE